ncbi:hypothetical protein GWI33_010276, partial [Rhynchophorus ferrugineus]
IDGLSTKVTRT